MNRFSDYNFIIATIIFTVYGQLIIKWRMTNLDSLPEDVFSKFKTLLCVMFDPLIISGLVAAFFASLAWMAALSKFSISHAYPFMSLNFCFVLILSGILLREDITWYKVIGVIMIVLGSIISSLG